MCSANSFQWVTSPVFAVSQLSEFYRGHKASERSRMNRKAIRASQYLPQLVLSVVAAQYFVIHIQDERPGFLPLIISLAINAPLTESISHEELRPSVWIQMPQCPVGLWAQGDTHKRWDGWVWNNTFNLTARGAFGNVWGCITMASHGNHPPAQSGTVFVQACSLQEGERSRLLLAHVNKALFLLAVIETRNFQQEFGVMPNFQARYSKSVFTKQARHNAGILEGFFHSNQRRPKWAWTNGSDVSMLTPKSFSLLWWFGYISWRWDLQYARFFWKR